MTNEKSEISKSLKLASDLCSGIAFIVIIYTCFVGFCSFSSGLNFSACLVLFICVILAGAFWWVSNKLKNRSKVGGVIGFILLGGLICGPVFSLMNLRSGLTGTLDFWSDIAMLLIFLTAGISLALSWDELN